MIKTIFAAAIGFAVTGLAEASPFPAPPTETYTPSATMTCAGETLNIYFPAGTSALTPASQALLEAAQERLDGCIVGQVSLNAKSGDARSAREASSLSAARIETVATALEARDLSGMHLDSDTIATPTTQSPWAPMDRKVEITLAAWAPEIS